MSEKLTTKDDFKEFIKKQEKLFNHEFTFQFALAWYLKEKVENDGNKCDVEFESKEVYKNDEEDGKCRCDLVFKLKNYIGKIYKQVYVELKYIKTDDSTATSVGARQEFIKDFTRLRDNLKNLNTENNEYAENVEEEKYCIFLTNWDVCYTKENTDENSHPLLKRYNNNLREEEGNEKIWMTCEFGNSEKFHFLMLDVCDEEIKKKIDIKYNDVITLLKIKKFSFDESNKKIILYKGGGATKDKEGKDIRKIKGNSQDIKDKLDEHFEFFGVDFDKEDLKEEYFDYLKNKYKQN